MEEAIIAAYSRVPAAEAARSQPALVLSYVTSSGGSSPTKWNHVLHCTEYIIKFIKPRSITPYNILTSGVFPLDYVSDL